MKADLYKTWKKSNQLYVSGHKRLARLLYIYMRIVFSCDIPYTSKIGEGVIFKHFGLGVVINPDAIIGDNCIIYQRANFKTALTECGHE